MKKLFYDMPHHLLNTFFECPELISTKMNWHPSTFTYSPPQIKLPFPPPITAQDIVLKRPYSKICSKSPNAFFIYRKAFFDQLALLNQRFKMTDVSKLVSLYWKNERREVKEAYKKIAQEVELELSERRKRDLVYPDINTKARRGKGNNVSKKKCGKVTKMTDNQSESANFERVGSAVVNRQCGTHFELTFGSDMQPLIHSYHVDLENYLMSNRTLDDAVFSSSGEPIIAAETNDNDDNNFIVSEPTLDQNDVNDYAQRNNSDSFAVISDDDDDVLDPIPAQSQNSQPPVENDVNSVLLNAQNVAFDEFCFDDNTNLNWYLQSFV